MLHVSRVFNMCDPNNQRISGSGNPRVIESLDASVLRMQSYSRRGGVVGGVGGGVVGGMDMSPSNLQNSQHMPAGQGMSAMHQAWDWGGGTSSNDAFGWDSFPTITSHCDPMNFVGVGGEWAGGAMGGARAGQVGQCVGNGWQQQVGGQVPGMASAAQAFQHPCASTLPTSVPSHCDVMALDWNISAGRWDAPARAATESAGGAARFNVNSGAWGEGGESNFANGDGGGTGLGPEVSFSVGRDEHLQADEGVAVAGTEGSKMPPAKPDASRSLRDFFAQPSAVWHLPPAAANQGFADERRGAAASNSMHMSTGVRGGRAGIGGGEVGGEIATYAHRILKQQERVAKSKNSSTSSFSSWLQTSCGAQAFDKVCLSVCGSEKR